jgi:GNAT superfamily N-acetyltransferase
MVSIRRATPADLKLLQKLETEFCRDERAAVISANRGFDHYVQPSPLRSRTVARLLRKMLRSTNARVFIAEQNGKPIAFCTASIEKGGQMYLPMRFGLIGWVFVKKPYRGKRISSQLMAEMLHWFAKRKIEQISLSVLAGNQPARAIWKKWGFHDFVIFAWKLNTRT